MGVLSVFKAATNSISNSMFGFDRVVPREDLFELLSFTPPIYIGSSKDVQAYLDFLVTKFDLKSITVLGQDGSILGQSSTSRLNNPQFLQQVFPFMSNSLPQSDFISVRADNWYSFYPYKNFIFAIEAGDSVSLPELRALANELINFVSN